MKRLCVFYKFAWKWQGKPVEWIVCKQCQKKVTRGGLFALLLKARNEYLETCR